MKKGLVYRSTGSWYSVESDGCFYACRIKGKLRLKGIKSTNPIAVGDRVWFEVDENAVEPEGDNRRDRGTTKLYCKKVRKPLQTNPYYSLKYRSSIFADNAS